MLFICVKRKICQHGEFSQTAVTYVVHICRVISELVGKALQMAGMTEVKSTAEFVLMFDKFLMR